MTVTAIGGMVATWRWQVRQFNVGDLVRYRQGSLDEKGVVLGTFGSDYRVLFFSNNKVAHCRWRCLEVIK